jgi:trehalose 6-phosphate phosphatase
MTPPSIFSSSGLRALRRLARLPTIMCFDIDGTLAPLVAQPDQAAVPHRTAALLAALCRVRPVAVITGRSAADGVRLLGFTPRILFGNHGAERHGRPADPRLRSALDAHRIQLLEHAAGLDAHRIEVEDKGASIALHYRRAPDVAAALQWLDGVIARVQSPGCVELGHAVVNLTAPHAPDKGDALAEAMSECGVAHALHIGDDTNDEPAFAKLRPPSMGIRVGSDAAATCADHVLPQQSQIDALLQLLLADAAVSSSPHAAPPIADRHTTPAGGDRVRSRR